MSGVTAFQTIPFTSSPNTAPTIGAADETPFAPLFFPDRFFFVCFFSLIFSLSVHPGKALRSIPFAPTLLPAPASFQSLLFFSS